METVRGMRRDKLCDCLTLYAYHWFHSKTMIMTLSKIAGEKYYHTFLAIFTAEHEKSNLHLHVEIIFLVNLLPIHRSIFFKIIF